MGRKQVNILCVSCESPLRADSPFCPTCGRPTHWATHEERVEWEVRQWRASRAREGAGSATTMMLVRTEAGYEPSPMRPGDQYVWDQPLHPEREEQTPAQRPTPQTPDANGNGNGHRAEGSPPEEAPHTPSAPAVEAPIAPSPTPDVATVERGAGAGEQPERESVIGISKKAVAVGLVLAVGLPLSGKALHAFRSSSRAAHAPLAGPARAQTAGSISPLALTGSRSGFSQVTPDAARYAVVIRNPNRGFAAFGIDVSVSMHDRSGRLIGTTTERLGSVPAGGASAVAGQTGVAGRVARLKTRISVAAFEPSRGTHGFTVRGVRMMRRGAAVTVRASVAGANPARDARLVVVYFDREGRIVGGDFTYLDIPAAPRAATAIVTTTGVPRSMHRVGAYVATSP